MRFALVVRSGDDEDAFAENNTDGYEHCGPEKAVRVPTEIFCNGEVRGLSVLSGYYKRRIRKETFTNFSRGSTNYAVLLLYWRMLHKPGTG